MRHAVILAGGSGTRLWPVSRKNTPKQFHPLVGEFSLIKQTAERLVGTIDQANLWVVTTKELVEQTLKELPHISHNQVIAEPAGRNTAAAIALVTKIISEKDPEASIGVIPSDHHIGKPGEFTNVVRHVYDFLDISPEHVIVIGIKPTEPNTGYGYIEMGESLKTIKGQPVFGVKSFHEKPDLVTAKRFFESWEYLWNGGYFFFKATQMLTHFKKLTPSIISKVEEYLSSKNEKVYESIEAESIDRAIAEHLDTLAVMPADLDWSDLGNWATLHEVLNTDTTTNNVIMGEHIGIDTSSCLIAGKKLIATVGLKDTVIIETSDAILICPKNRVQDVKKLVEQLQHEEKHHYL